MKLNLLHENVDPDEIEKGDWIKLFGIADDVYGRFLGRKKSKRSPVGDRILGQFLVPAFVGEVDPESPSPYLVRWIPLDQAEKATPDGTWESWRHDLTGETVTHPPKWRRFYEMDKYKKYWLY